MTTSNVSPGDALDRVRASWKTRVTEFPARHCLEAVRTYYGIPAKYATAREAREHAKTFVKYNGDPESIPYGAFVFSRAKGTTGTAEHVFLRGGHAHGKVIAWTVDAVTLGDFSPVRFKFFAEKWGHEILGWSRDINDVEIDTVNPAKKPAAKKAAAKKTPAKKTAVKKTVTPRKKVGKKVGTPDEDKTAQEPTRDGESKGTRATGKPSQSVKAAQSEKTQPKN